MTKKENMNKIIDYLIEIETKEKETEKDLSIDRTFMRILKKTNLHQNVLSEALQTLEKNFEIEKSKNPLSTDKRSYPYRLTNKSIREKRKLEKTLFENKCFEIENNQTLRDFFEKMIKTDLDSKGIEKHFTHKIKSIKDYAEELGVSEKQLISVIPKNALKQINIKNKRKKLTYPRKELISKYSLEILDFVIFQMLGLNIIFSSKKDSFFDHFKRDRKNVKKEVYYYEVIGPLIATGIQLLSGIIGPNYKSAQEPFQIVINFSPDEDLDKTYKDLKNKILIKELKERNLITESDDIVNLLNNFQSFPSEIAQLQEDISSILRLQSLYDFSRLLSKNLMEHWFNSMGYYPVTTKQYLELSEKMDPRLFKEIFETE